MPWPRKGVLGGVGEPRDLLAGVLEAPGSHPCCLETLKSLDLCLFPTPHVSGWGRRLIFHGARDFPGYIFSLGLTSASCSVSGDGLCTFPGILIGASPSPWAPHRAVPSGIPGGDPWTTVGGAPWGQDVDTGRGVDGVVSWSGELVLTGGVSCVVGVWGQGAESRGWEAAASLAEMWGACSSLGCLSADAPWNRPCPKPRRRGGKMRNEEEEMAEAGKGKGSGRGRGLG